MLEVVTASVDVAVEAVADYRTLLSPDELERADRYRFEKHRRRFTVARGMLRQHLGRYLNQSPERIVIDVGENGRPYVDAPLQFNVSHSHEMAVFAFGQVDVVGNVGIDIEHIRTLHDRTAVATRFFSAAEQTALFSYPESEQTAVFFRIWTRKEAYLKALGTGLTRSPRSFSVSADNEPRLLDDPLRPAAVVQYQPVAVPADYTAVAVTVV